MRIGIDIGGTQVKIGFVENKQIVDKYAIDTNKETLFDDICKSIINRMKELNLNDTNIEAIGVGVPGSVVQGYINFLPNIGIKDYDLHKKIKEYFPNVLVASINDATAAALGESIVNDIQNAVFVTLGTGVGGGVVVNGKVLEGRNGAAGEIGHMKTDFVHDYKCTCGLSGCLETVASATGIVRLANEYISDYPNSVLCNKIISAKDVFDAAKAGDELASKVFLEYCHALGKALAMLAVTTDPDSFIIGGGVSKAGDFLINGIKKAYEKYAHFAVKDTKIVLASLGNDAGILGAAYLV